jgi:hypothetical protein
MAEMQKEEFKFPDEVEEGGLDVDFNDTKGVETEDKPVIEIEDDTPPEDRNRDPMPKELLDEIDKDELDKYSEEAQARLKQMRKVYHDERRAKEAAYREQQEAIKVTQKVMEENKKFKNMLQTGGQEYANTLQNAANLELEMAKRNYKEAYDSGDTDRIVDAQQAMQQANLRLMQAQNFRMPSLQEENYDVQMQEEQVQPVQRPDNKVMAWQERNQWFGQDEEMTASALGLHEKLKRSGVIIGSDEYYATLDKTMRKRFSEYFEPEVEAKPKEVAPKAKSSTVVAPATRTTSSKQIRLKASQVQLAKKLGLTPEQYARELLKMEA